MTRGRGFFIFHLSSDISHLLFKTDNNDLRTGWAYTQK